MQLIAILTVGCALLAAGCNSKNAEAPGPQGTAEVQPTGSAPKAFVERRSEKAPPTSTNTASAATESSQKSATATSLHAAVQAASTARGAVEIPPAPADEPAPDEAVREEDLPMEGDDIRIPPKMLGKLIPGLNLESVDREDPISVTALLEAQGIVFTSYRQLVELGVTNYQVIRAENQPRKLLEASKTPAQ